MDVHSCHLLIDHFQFTVIHRPNIPGSYAIVFLQHQTFLLPPEISAIDHRFLLWLGLWSLSGDISLLSPSRILDTFDLGGSSSRGISFSFSYCLWGFWGESSEMVCHSLLQWTMFCQSSPPWPVLLGGPAWYIWLIVSLSYTRLWFVWSVCLAFCDFDFHFGGCAVIVLVSSVCPLMDEDKGLV